MTQDEIDQLLEALRLKHPMATEFAPPVPSCRPDGSGGTITVEYLRPSDGDISNYIDSRYPQWIESCRGILIKLHERVDERNLPVRLRWSMANRGTRPASQVRIDFQARGQLEIRRLDERDEDANGTAAEDRTPPARFPSAPRPPAFQERVT